MRKNNMRFNKSCILVLFKCFFKVDWNFNLSLNKEEKLQICQTLNFYNSMLNYAVISQLFISPRSRWLRFEKHAKTGQRNVMLCQHISVRIAYKTNFCFNIDSSLSLSLSFWCLLLIRCLLQINFCWHASISDCVWYLLEMTFVSVFPP